MKDTVGIVGGGSEGIDGGVGDGDSCMWPSGGGISGIDRMAISGGDTDFG